MRNLKRALSLAMASIMILGMMVVGAGAASFDDFSDKDKVVNKEAVSVLNTLGVIAGKDDGAFDPTGIVTRAEMAKMICVVLNGGKNPQLGDLTTNFKDTKGHWAEPFIAWCTNLGIVAGTGGGNFEPDTTVTGSQAAKMLLVALGFNADIEKYVGGSWQLNVDVAANQNDLYDNLGNINTSEGLSRDNAAQMIYNALDVKMVEYKNVYVSENGTLTSKPQVSSDDKGTLLEEKFNAVKLEGVVVGNEYADLSSKKTDNDYATGVIGTALEAGKSKIVVTNTEDQEAYSGTETFSVATGKAELGRSVTLFVKKDTNASKATVIGSAIINEDNKVVTDYTSDSINDVADDNDLSIESTTQVVTNYASMAKLGEADAKKDGVPGVEKIMIDTDGDGDVDYLLLNTVQFGKVTKYSATDKGTITVSLEKGNFTMDNSKNVVGFEDVAKDDFVLASFIGGKLHVEKPETVTGTVEAYKNNSGDLKTTKLTVDGTDRTISDVPSYTSAGDEIFPANQMFVGADKTMLDTDATFYLDAQGYIIARGAVKEAAYNYAYVSAVDKVGVTVDSRVKVYLSDGTNGVYTLNDKSPVKLANVEAGTVYAYSLGSDKTIKLTEAHDSTTDGGSAVFEKGKSTITMANHGAAEYATNSTAFFYVGNDNTVNTYIGRANAPSISSSTGSFVYKNSADTVVAAVFTGVMTTASVGDHLFVYSLGNVHSDYTTANVVLNGKDTTEPIKVDAGSKSILEPDALYTYTVNSDGYYELTAASGEDFFKTGTVQYAYNTSIVINGVGEYVLNAQTVVIDNDGNPSTPSAIFNGNIGKGDTVQVLVRDTDKAAMVVITKAADSGSGNSNAPTEMKTVLNSDNTINVFNPSGASFSTVVNAAAAVLENDGYTDIKTSNQTSGAAWGARYATLTAKKGVITTDFDVYRAVRVDVNGTEAVGYANDDADVTVTSKNADTPMIITKNDGTTYIYKADAEELTTGSNKTAPYSFTLNDQDAYGVVTLRDAAKVTYTSVTGALKSDSTKAVDSNDFVPVGTTLTITGTSTASTSAKKYITATATVGGEVLATGTTAASDKATLDYNVTNDFVTFKENAAAADASFAITKDVSMTAPVAGYADGVYTDQKGAKYTVTVSEGDKADTELTITVTPQRASSAALTFAVASAGFTETLSWTNGTNSQTFYYTLAAGANDMTVKDGYTYTPGDKAKVVFSTSTLTGTLQDADTMSLILDGKTYTWTYSDEADVDAALTKLADMVSNGWTAEYDSNADTITATKDDAGVTGITGQKITATLAGTPISEVLGTLTDGTADSVA